MSLRTAQVHGRGAAAPGRGSQGRG